MPNCEKCKGDGTINYWDECFFCHGKGYFIKLNDVLSIKDGPPLIVREIGQGSSHVLRIGPTDLPVTIKLHKSPPGYNVVIEKV